MNGAYVLEFTEKALGDEVPAPAVFRLLTEFFDILENREKGIGHAGTGIPGEAFQVSGSDASAAEVRHMR